MSYIGNSPGVASQRVTTTLTATASQTQFTTQSGYVLGYVDVYLNGAKLVNGSDFEAITGTYITLFAGASVGDVVELISYVPRGLSDGYTKAEADAKFLDVGGDTATGSIFLGAGGLVVGTTQLVTSGTNNVGINTASPKTNGATFGTLTLNGSNGGAIQFTTADVNIAQIYNDGNALFINPSTGKTLSLQVAGSTVASVSSTGISITGTLSNTTGVGLATASGNVGIGISSASASGKFHVYQASGSMYITVAGGIPRMNIGGGNGWGFNRITASEDIFFGEPGDTGTWRVRGSGTISLGVGNTDTTMTIVGNGGNVGIGTTNPTNKLDVNGSAVFRGNTSIASGNILYLSNSVNTGSGTIFCPGGGSLSLASYGNEMIRLNEDNAIIFKVGSATERARIDSSGNLTIGPNGTANTNSSKLVVNGTISQTVGSTQYLVVDQSDVGTAPNQIPLNQYLGSMAFQDRENVNFTGGTGALSSLDIAAISAQLNVSATDVFVYDTSKDSDGGAWRKRCQHTSWYNETLNTQTRGARREFPAVAVIVATATSLTIYDGDSPDLPMWMVFNQGGSWPSNNIIGQTSSGSLTAVAALNAIITVSVASDAVRLINFVSEETRFPWPGSPRIYFSNIQNRNASSGWRNGTFGTIGTIASNDVAMTVLPNAAIDSATGLPIPIVAVATNGGVSLIKDTGTVTTVTAAAWDPSPKGAQQVMFSGEYILFTGQEYAYYQMDWYIDKINNFGRFADTASYDSAQNQIASSGDGSSIAGFQLGNVGYQSGSIYAVSTAAGNGQFYYGRGLDSSANGGLYLMSPNYADMPKSMVAHIGKTYNSGWQVGLSKGAWLSDTTQETIIGTGNLAGWSTASNWIKQPSISLSWTGSAISITGNGTGSSVYFMLPITVVPNTNYTFTISFTAWNAVSPVLNVNQYAMSGVLVNIGTSTPGTYTFSFNSGSNTTVYLQSYQVSTTASVITNFDLRKSELDRSVYPKGLFIAGTLNKTPVAANADLVGYSGFTANNYLTQPYNSSLDFGTGDFSVSTWINPNNQGSIGGIHLVFNGAASGLTGTAFGILGGSSGRIDLVIGGVQHSNETIVDPGDIWQHLVVTRRSGVFYCYVNGILKFTNSNVVNLTGIVTQLYIGGYFYSGNFTAVNNKFALLRMSATAPSVDQIRKMYNDEKHLFQENAKAALYGTSDAVTAVAYDEHTQLLHAGTSSGRSVFDGLRRVDNTTTAVATAISAADGLVVEN